jgi:PTS system nitrogen regulatory IIA component
MMKVEEFLSPAEVLIGMPAPDKKWLLGDLARRAGSVLKLSPDTILSELSKREDLGSTGLGEGVALPHARFRALTKPYGMLARLKQGIDFDAIDNRPVDIVFLLLLPASPQGEQLNALASVARRLRNKDVLREIRAADDVPSLHRAITK